VTITGVVMEATFRGWPVWICDPKTVEFIGLRRWPNVQLVATSIEHMVTVILKAQQEMERRYSLVEAEIAEDDEFEPLVLVLDEYRDFVGMVTAWWARIKVKGMPTKCPVFEAVSSSPGRAVPPVSTSSWGRSDLTPSSSPARCRDNFASRMSLGRLSPQGAMMMWEAAYIGVSIPRGVPGRGTAVDDDEHPVEVQGYWTPDPRRAEKKGNVEDLAILERLRPAEISHRALQVSLADELLYDLDADPGKGDPEPNWWAAIQEAQLVPALDFELGPRAAAIEMTKRPTSARLAAVPGTAGDDLEQADDAGDEEVDDAAGELDEDFDVEQEIPARQVRPGDRMLVEPALDFWVVVEFAEPDIDDEDLVCIDWRGDADEAGSTSLPTSDLVSIRRPLVDVAEQ
jgi:S-DNA-T family DNA segregation ATPase FtsK/SpoIIIE